MRDLSTGNHWEHRAQSREGTLGAAAAIAGGLQGMRVQEEGLRELTCRAGRGICVCSKPLVTRTPSPAAPPPPPGSTAPWSLEGSTEPSGKHLQAETPLCTPSISSSPTKVWLQALSSRDWGALRALPRNYRFGEHWKLYPTITDFSSPHSPAPNVLAHSIGPRPSFERV